MLQRETGRVKWFNEKKGFGFIVTLAKDESGGVEEKIIDIFVHYKDIKGKEGTFKTLHEGDDVSFVMEKGPKGFKAQDVALVSATDNN